MEIGTGMTENQLLAALQDAMGQRAPSESEHPTTEWLAERMGVPRRKVQDTLRQLVRSGIVEPYKVYVMGCNGILHISYAYKVKEQDEQRTGIGV